MILARAITTDQPSPSDQEVLAGLVERVTYHNAENGFCVLRIKARSHHELITVVGYAAVIAAGEWVTASGEWVNDHTHGQQFKTRFMRTSAPTSVDGIEKYLGSGMIRGIGPVYAKKLINAFGEKVFDIIEAEPNRLREVTGIGEVRARRITEGWAEQKIIREIMVFLHSHGVGTARAVRIFKTYGSDAIQVMMENPYRLASDIRGIGFKTADAIAMKLGIEKTAMIRVRAGISYALSEAMASAYVPASTTPQHGRQVHARLEAWPLGPGSVLFRRHSTGVRILRTARQIRENSADRVAAFLKRRPVGFPVALDTRGDTADAYRFSGLPTLYLIGRDSIIRYVHQGFSGEFVPVYEQEIIDLLSQP